MSLLRKPSDLSPYNMGSNTDPAHLHADSHSYMSMPATHDMEFDVTDISDGEVQISAQRLPADHRNAFLACGKALDYLMKMERDGTVGLEKGSVYGAAVAIPQIARSAGWSGTMLALAARSYFFLLLNIILQGFLLSMIGEEANIMHPFAGQMHLCDFGADLENCPDAPNCRGPGGTMMTYARLYDYDTWSTRLFVRESLKSLFPDRSEEIDAVADPGEYGLEDYYCRAVCCFIFATAVMNDLSLTLSLVRLFWHLPSSDDKWIRFELPEWEDKHRAKKIRGWTELNLVKFGVAGLPLHWKFINILLVFCPKLILWLLLVNSGFHFLMETSGIVDVMMNALAMAFILNLDELIFSVLTTVPVKYMMENLEDYQLFSIEIEEREPEDACLSRFIEQELGPNRLRRFFSVVIPKRLLTVMVVTAFFLIKYYYDNCVEGPEGGLVSKPMYLPRHVSYNVMQFLFAPLEDMSAKPFWSMPDGA